MSCTPVLDWEGQLQAAPTDPRARSGIKPKSICTKAFSRTTPVLHGLRLHLNHATTSRSWVPPSRYEDEVDCRLSFCDCFDRNSTESVMSADSTPSTTAGPFSFELLPCPAVSASLSDDLELTQAMLHQRNSSDAVQAVA